MRCPVYGLLSQQLEQTKMRQIKGGLAYITAVLALSIKAASCSPNKWKVGSVPMGGSNGSGGGMGRVHLLQVNK